MDKYDKMIYVYLKLIIKMGKLIQNALTFIFLLYDST